MAKIFIAMENPASWLGNKYDNLPLSDRYQSGTLTSPKYVTRQHAFGGKKFDDVSAKKERGKIEAIFNSTSPFGPGNQGMLAASGSLMSMMNRLRHFGNSDSVPVDTIVFIGHGCAGTMAVGSGPFAYTDEQKQIFDMEKRDIDLFNTTAWQPVFEGIREQVGPGIGGRVHIFLLGCSTAVGSNRLRHRPTLISHVARTLHRALKHPVAVYGVNDDLDYKDTPAVVKNLLQIEASEDDSYSVPNTSVTLGVERAGEAE